MWCRAILATAAVTCTFIAVVHAHNQPQIKDIVCLLVLNGLQKDDLDVNTLKKLQRHNVNIDDMNNDDLRKDCETTSAISTALQLNEDKPSDIGEKQDQKLKLSDSNLQNIIINYFSDAQKSNKPTDSETTKSSETKLNTELPDVKNFLNMWNKFLKTRNDNDVATATEKVRLTNLDRTIKHNIRSDDSSMEYINNVLKNLIARKKTTTTDSPTTERVDYHLLAQKIQELLSNTRKEKTPSQITTLFAIGDVPDRMNYPTQNNNLKLFSPTQDKNTNSKEKNIFRNLSYLTTKSIIDNNSRPIRDIAERPSMQYNTQMNNQQITSLSDDIVKKISESIKAKVIQDLKKEMIASTKKPDRQTTAKTSTSTTKQAAKTTTTAVIPNQEKVNTTKMLEKIMEMIQQFKGKESSTKKAPQHKILNTDYLQSPLKFPPQYITPSNNMHPVDTNPITMTSMILNPYISGNAPGLQTGALPNPYSLLHINTPVHGLSGAKPVHKITQLNIFNTRNNYHPPPITIQTNSVEILPLGLPAAQQSFVYQNIVVTTKKPFFKTYHYTTHDRNGHSDVYKDFSFGGRVRSRESKDDEHYRDSRYTLNRYRDYGRLPYDHNKQRFHEKLERIDEWPRISRENRDDDSTPKLVTRHQLPLNDTNKRPRLDDEHFKKFLKTQQKVNDMLERILATKTLDNRHQARSVEINV